MKKILGLDLGTGSIGWAVVNERENNEERSSIAGLGVRVNPLTVDEQTNFEKGKPITTNADRTLKRSMRRNLQRYKLRRDCLVELLKANGFITDDTVLAENGNGTTFETYRLRARAATEEVTLAQLARVLLMLNKKRGYKSSRKARQKDEDGHLVDGMDAARMMYDEGLTPGQYALSLLRQGKRYVPDFYRSDLKAELDRIWDFQRQFRPSILTDGLKDAIQGKNKSQTWAVLAEPFGIKGIKREAKGDELRLENYRWRAEALEREIDPERLAIVLQEVNGQVKASSGYLGDISDRSKELYFRRMTVGQYQMAQLDRDPNYSLKNQVFYRQDYLDEFERIWETQAKYHGELTPELKHEVRDVVIFYQRPLKSQKGLVAHCEFESREVEVETAGGKRRVTMGLRVCPKSSPLYQEFRIWQVVNNVQVSDAASHRRFLDHGEKETLARELCFRDKMTKKEILKLLFGNHKELDLNYREIKGNTTMAALAKACLAIVDMSGHGQRDAAKMTADGIMSVVGPVFKALGFDAGILRFDSSLEGKAFAAQPSYRLWHLLYSFEGDKSKTGSDKLLERISGLCGLDREYAAVMAGLARLREAHVEHNLLTLVSQSNVHDPLGTYRYLRDELGCRFMQFIECVEFAPDGLPLPYAISPEEWADFVIAVFDEWHAHDMRTVSVRLFDSVVAKILTGNANSCAMGCDCREYVVVEHNGDVYPCDFFVRPELRLGNILENDWDEIWDNPLHTAFGARKRTVNPACERCGCRAFCQGDCPKNRTGHDASADPRTLSHLCPAWKRIYAHILPPLRKEAKRLKANG